MPFAFAHGPVDNVQDALVHLLRQKPRWSKLLRPVELTIENAEGRSRAPSEAYQLRRQEAPPPPDEPDARNEKSVEPVKLDARRETETTQALDERFFLRWPEEAGPW